MEQRHVRTFLGSGDEKIEDEQRRRIHARAARVSQTLIRMTLSVYQSHFHRSRNSQGLVDGIDVSLGENDVTEVAASLERLVDGWDVGNAGV